MCRTGWGWPGRSMLWSTTASSIRAPTRSNTQPRVKICQTRMGRSLKLLHLSKMSLKWHLLSSRYRCRLLHLHPRCHSHRLPCCLRRLSTRHLRSLQRPLCWPFRSPCLWSTPHRPALICHGAPARTQMCTLGSGLSGRPGSPASPTNQQSSCLNIHLSDFWRRSLISCTYSTECPQIGR